MSQNTPDGEKNFIRHVARKQARKRRAREHPGRSAWFGLGMFGLVGWSVAVPTVVGVLLGVWLDVELEGDRSWTLTGLGAGLGLGCLTAMYWVRREAGLDSPPNLKTPKRQDSEDANEEEGS